MAEHSEHYPTMIENPKTKARVAVRSPLEHHRQLLAWKQPGLVPAPEPAVENPQPGPTSEPGYPTMIENDKTGERVRVDTKADHDAQLADWDSVKPKSTTRGAQAAAPPANPAATAKAKAAATKTGAKSDSAPIPPTKEELMKKGHSEGVAQKIADEEVRKFNAGQSPYDAKE